MRIKYRREIGGIWNVQYERALHANGWLVQSVKEFRTDHIPISTGPKHRQRDTQISKDLHVDGVTAQLGSLIMLLWSRKLLNCNHSYDFSCSRSRQKRCDPGSEGRHCKFCMISKQETNELSFFLRHGLLWTHTLEVKMSQRMPDSAPNLRNFAFRNASKCPGQNEGYLTYGRHQNASRKSDGSLTHAYCICIDSCMHQNIYVNMRADSAFLSDIWNSGMPFRTMTRHKKRDNAFVSRLLFFAEIARCSCTVSRFRGSGSGEIILNVAFNAFPELW